MSPTFGPNTGEITALLQRAEHGDGDAHNQLARLVRASLKRIAANRLRRERPNHFYQTSDLVQEAYLRLIQIEGIAWKDRAHFYRVAALQMRRILVEYARRQRPENHDNLLLDDVPGLKLIDKSSLLRVDELLHDLAKIDARRALLVELRYFGGFEIKEVAEITGIPLGTVKRHWAAAKAFVKLQFNLPISIADASHKAATHIN